MGALSVRAGAHQQDGLGTEQTGTTVPCTAGAGTPRCQGWLQLQHHKPGRSQSIPDPPLGDTAGLE